jgi:hypothetical protein
MLAQPVFVAVIVRVTAASEAPGVYVGARVVPLVNVPVPEADHDSDV